MKFSIFSVSDYYEDEHDDPSSFYRDQIDIAVFAEQLGFHGYFAAEHHFHPYGLVPDPALLLSSIAAKTETLKLDPAVSILPFHNPLRAAEQWSMVDQLSQGRLILGVGSGYLHHEFEGFGMSPATKRDHFDDALEVLEKAMAGKRVTHQSKYFQAKKVRLNILPYKKRKVEIKIAILAELASYHVGKRGYGIMTIPYATVEKVDDATPLYASYRKGWDESGLDGNGDVIAAMHAHVSDYSS
ncbi:MAG: LLM class flavin-dependent oxidoreductase, partial [Candidatus Electryonea clarkiae]|nr:LLM class flavin-dependent oxidoreductase [Candidatus Electryonea clarkiae]